LHHSQFPSHPVDSRTKRLWEDPVDDDQLRRYFGYQGLIICPTCELLMADVEELRNEHRNAGGFAYVTKKEIFDKRKLLVVLFILLHLLNFAPLFSSSSPTSMQCSKT
jgi:hypothetical protein